MIKLLYKYTIKKYYSNFLKMLGLYLLIIKILVWDFFSLLIIKILNYNFLSLLNKYTLD